MPTSKELENFCCNIRNLRKLHDLSQKQMAEKLHIGIGSLKKIENGQVPPRLGIDVLFYIHKHFGFTPAQIVTVNIVQIE